MNVAGLPIRIDPGKIAEFCRARGIRKLSLFGSVLRDDFDPARSDVDVLVGEAVKRLPPELRDRYMSVPWRQVAGMGDRLSHGYDDIRYHVLWDAVHKDLPGLLATVEQMLHDLESSDGV